jgi:glycosyltransferase involved in cell wall biosynthesis
MKIKVLMLPKWYPSRLDSAEGNYVERHVRAISAYADVAVLYVHSDADIKDSYELVQALENGYPVYRVFFRRSESGWRFLDQAVNLYRYFRAQKKGYDVLKHTFGPISLTHVHVLTRTSFFALYLSWTEGIPFLISEHWSGFLRERRAFSGVMLPAISRWLARQSELITCVSHSQKIGMQDYGFTGRFEVIPNVVDADLFVPDTEAQPNGKKSIIHISRLDSHPKNVPGILRATRQLRELRDDFELHLLGAGAEEDQQKALSHSLGLDGIAFFHGYMSHAEVAKLLSRSCFLLMFSDYETQSCAILEAFSCGIPVIATDAGGIPEILLPERGYLVAPGDERALTDAMHKMLDSYEAFSGSETRSYAVSHFGEKVVGERFLDIYTSCLSKNRHTKPR